LWKCRYDTFHITYNYSTSETSIETPLQDINPTFNIHTCSNNLILTDAEKKQNKCFYHIFIFAFFSDTPLVHSTNERSFVSIKMEIKFIRDVTQQLLRCQMPAAGFDSSAVWCTDSLMTRLLVVIEWTSRLSVAVNAWFTLDVHDKTLLALVIECALERDKMHAVIRPWRKPDRCYKSVWFFLFRN